MRKQTGGKGKGKSKARKAAERELSVSAALSGLPPSNNTKKTRDNVEKFLFALAEGYSPSEACAAIQISRETAYRWREEDEAFAKAWTKALDMGTNALEDVAQTRARKGSDVLMIFLLKARDPKRFRDGPRGGSVQFPGDESGGGDDKAKPVRFTFDFGSGITPNEED